MIPEPASVEVRPAEREPSWGYRDLLMFLCLGFFAIVTGQLTAAGVAAVLHLDRTALLLPAQLLVYVLLFGVLASIIKLQYGRSLWRSLAWEASAISPAAAVTAGVAMALALALVGALLRIPDVDSPMKRLLAQRGALLEFAVLGCTVGPFCEELVFRGFMQPVVVRSLGPPLGILITACFFGALHLAQYGFLWQTGLLITAAGLGFGWMRQLTGSTQASTWMHAGYNLTFFLTLFTQHATK